MNKLFAAFLFLFAFGRSEDVRKYSGQIVACEIHFSRIPGQYWENRIKMARSMGCNALSIYVMWNFHEVSKGVFDYSSVDRNLTNFLALTVQNGLMIMLRPGPYVCAEWDFGGFPVRLLQQNPLILRKYNMNFFDQVRIYFQSLLPIINKFIDNGLLMIQVQNEYASFGSDSKYIHSLRNMWIDLGVDCDFYIVDVFGDFEKFHWIGANFGINAQITPQKIRYLRTFQKTGRIFGGEIYSGWLTHWGQPVQGIDYLGFMDQFQFLLQNNISFSVYMFHGGSNFGLTAGANDGSIAGKGNFGGAITSYDYKAPLSQNGQPNAKYFGFRQLAQQYLPWAIPDVPDAINTIDIDVFVPQIKASMLMCLPPPSFTAQTKLIAFESSQLNMLNQGFVLYQTQIKSGNHMFSITAHDFTLVFLDNEFLRTLDRTTQADFQISVSCNQSKCSLRLLVEAMGHINYGQAMYTDLKGLLHFSDKKGTVFKWSAYKIPIQNPFQCNVYSNSSFPQLFVAQLTLAQIGDTYFEMKNWKKGYVWVNNRNLGRYWNRGPFSRIYCPGVWLKKGINQIVVLDLLQRYSVPILGFKNLTDES